MNSSTSHSNLPPAWAQVQSEVSRRAKQFHERPEITPASPVGSSEKFLEWIQPPLLWGEVLAFRTGGSGVSFLRHGWSCPEGNLVWSDGPSASLVLPVVANAPALLVITAIPFVTERGSQTVVVLADGLAVATWLMHQAGRFIALLPARNADSAELRLTFRIAWPISPKERGMGDDSRRLGLGLQAIELRPY